MEEQQEIHYLCGAIVEYSGENVPPGWEEVEGKSVITAGINDNYTTTSNAYENLTLDNEIFKKRKQVNS